MADKIILKRSSILGKRPDNKVIQAGELALNTNSEDPGAFFEVSNGSVIKIGPASVSSLPPVSSPEKGEEWYNLESGTLNIGTLEGSKKVWRSIASPYLGGSEIVFFVAPEFPFSNDSLVNDGQALPYQSFNRALLEVAKRKIKSFTVNGKAVDSQDRYVIYLAPSLFSAHNTPGVTPGQLSLSSSFDEDGFSHPSISDLIQFNSPEGGLIVPGGVSIRGLDMRKCEVKPSYVPKFSRPGVPKAEAGENEPLSSIFKMGGNTSCSYFSVSDKTSRIRVSKVDQYNLDALFFSEQPHGLVKNDQVTVSFSSQFDQTNGNFKAGQYYANPLDTFSFRLSQVKIGDPVNQQVYVAFADLPPVLMGEPTRILCSLEPHSAHRLRAFSYASVEELADFYTKVQKALPGYFGGAIIDGKDIVNEGGYDIIAPSEDSFIDNFSPTYSKNSSCHFDNVSVRSFYGMALGDFDGDTVEGLRSSVIENSYVISVQNDPAAYEVYTTVTDPSTGVSEQKWWPLIQACYYSLAPGDAPSFISEVSREAQMDLLRRTPIDKIRYFYQSLKDPQGKSFGITDIQNDFRNFGVRSLNSGYVKLQNFFTVGPAIGAWSLNGGYISISNSNSSFGSVALKTEGFRGIGTAGGSSPNSKNFFFSGIQTPLALNRQQAEDNANKAILSLGSRISDVRYDPNDPGVQLVVLTGDFLPCYILPFSLKPGSALWVSSSDCTYRGFFATDGGPTILSNPGPCASVTLRIRASDSTIPSDPTLLESLDIPYIRRFKDPREESDRSYAIVVDNTSSQTLAPSIGSVLRLSQTSQGQGISPLRPNVQFDPGASGGWGRVFSVSNVSTATKGCSPNFNNVVGNSTQDSRYLINLSVVDYSRPWEQNQDNPQGDYVTYQNKNWYAAENNTWGSVYYGNISSPFGPTKIPPTEVCSPFVDTSSLERQDVVEETYQGSYANDSKTKGEGAEEYNKYSYFRGSSVPYSEYSADYPLDDDDGTNSLGLLLKQRESGKITTLVSPISGESVIQTEQLPSFNQRYRPEIVRFSVLSSVNIPNPKQTVSVLKLSLVSPSSVTLKEEYLRVVSLNGNAVEAIRLNSRNSFYPDPINSSGSQTPEWPSQTVAKICSSNPIPSVDTYDPKWANTKRAVYRLLEVLGYSQEALEQCPKPLQPYYWGDRLVGVSSLPSSPDLDGYALSTAQWPIEFNEPSKLIASSHNWAFCGYPILNERLTKQQTSEISRKLSYDFLSTSVWGGKMFVSGVNEKGDLISLGTQREALTSQEYPRFKGVGNLANQQIYEEQPYVEFPAQVIVYSVDPVFSQFDGSQVTFELKKGGLPVPGSQLNVYSMVVQLGGVVQQPVTDYSLVNNSIVFSVPPLAKTTCDVRIITSEDDSKTLTCVPLELTEPIDGQTSTFTLVSTDDISSLVIDQENTFVLVGGVQQIPGAEGSYVISRTSPNSLSITFTEPLPKGVTVDIRAFCSGAFWQSQGRSPVAVYSLDSISPEFSPLTQQKEFVLTYKGRPINPNAVNTYNTLVSVGGVLQLPGDSYVIENGVIKFSSPPVLGSSSDLRVITNAEFLPCINSQGFTEGFINWGASVVLGLISEVASLKKEVG